MALEADGECVSLDAFLNGLDGTVAGFLAAGFALAAVLDVVVAAAFEPLAVRDRIGAMAG